MKRSRLLMTAGLVAVTLVVLALSTETASARGRRRGASSRGCRRICTVTAVNRTCSALRVWVDGWHQGVVRSGSRAVTSGLAPGWHTITVAGCCGRQTRRFYGNACNRHRYEVFTCRHCR